MVKVTIECDGQTDFHKYPDYPDCKCGRSSCWYSGITNEQTKEFTCIFCLSGFKEGSLEAIALYGSQGKEHKFFRTIELTSNEVSRLKKNHPINYIEAYNNNRQNIQS